ncbi:hypothetical protein NPIL_386931 [Nephila pilipes]|uniref:Uncharacterized protein n=1 Tax=Nephila pilipes TaxID=299642 RepID=A0A8X6PXR0_NEPPI|nr:hypothetical protein NPIL_386931 [Nephila pilipes]
MFRLKIATIAEEDGDDLEPARWRQSLSPTRRESILGENPSTTFQLTFEVLFHLRRFIRPNDRKCWRLFGRNVLCRTKCFESEILTIPSVQIYLHFSMKNGLHFHYVCLNNINLVHRYLFFHKTHPSFSLVKSWQNYYE